jgi:hypothetical protein
MDLLIKLHDEVIKDQVIKVAGNLGHLERIAVAWSV